MSAFARFVIWAQSIAITFANHRSCLNVNTTKTAYACSRKFVMLQTSHITLFLWICVLFEYKYLWCLQKILLMFPWEIFFTFLTCMTMFSWMKSEPCQKGQIMELCGIQVSYQHIETLMNAVKPQSMFLKHLWEGCWYTTNIPSITRALFSSELWLTCLWAVYCRCSAVSVSDCKPVEMLGKVLNVLLILNYLS